MSLSVLVAQFHDLHHDIPAILAPYGMAVESVQSASECLAKLREKRPDVLVLDRQLPGGGDQLLAWLSDKGEATGSAVVLIGDETAEAIAELVRPPVAFYLRKPYRLLNLLDCVRIAAAAHRGDVRRGTYFPDLTMEAGRAANFCISSFINGEESCSY